MEEMASTALIVSVGLIFIGFWVWFLYMIFSFLFESYDKKPLKYISIKKDNKSNKIVNKSMNIKESFYGFLGIGFFYFSNYCLRFIGYRGRKII